jgi:hypothetical protein
MKRGAGDSGEVAAGRRWVLWLGALVAAAGLAGCGGSGGGGASSGGPPPSSNPPPSGNPPAGPAPTGVGAVKVKVTDRFGDLVSGADVYVDARNFSATKATNASGEVQFDDVPAGRAEVCARHAVRGDFRNCWYYPVTVDKDKVLEVSRQLEVYEPESAAVLQATVDPGGISTDGRRLDLTIRVAVTGAREGTSWFLLDGWAPGAEQCEARTGAELVELGPRCIASGLGGDISYVGELVSAGVVRSVAGLPRSRAVGLLIDQSEAGLSPDWAPNEPRLFHAKVLADSLLPDVPLVIAGFASDTATGSASALPRRPVTFFPVEAPGFIGSRPDAFETLNGLAGRVGGGAPLYEAIAAGIEFMADQAPPGSLPTLVVLADGTDSSCGTPAQCAEWRRTIVRRAQETGVRLFLVGSSAIYNEDTDGEECSAVDDEWESYLCLLTFGAKAPLQQLSAAGAMPLVVSWSPELVRQWLAGSMTVQDVRIRLTSEVEGAFYPWNTVTGRLRGSNASWCPWDCYVLSLPFRVQVTSPVN